MRNKSTASLRNSSCFKPPAIALVLLASLVCCVIAARKIKFLSDQEALMNFSNPPSMVVYEEDPARARRLATSQPHSYDFNEGFNNGAKIKDPVQWQNFSMMGHGEVTGDRIFSHGLRASGGSRRLVAIQFGDSSVGEKHLRRVEWDVIRPGTLTSRPFLLRTGRLYCPIIGFAPMRVFGCQPDAADSSHFTMPFEVGDKRGIMEGWLQSDDTIVMSIRDGPKFWKSLAERN